MSQVWVNGKFFTSENKKAKKWKPEPPQEEEKVLWGHCSCGELIYIDDWVGMKADHEIVVCLSCWHAGKLPVGHVDICGFQLSDITLSN